MEVAKLPMRDRTRQFAQREVARHAFALFREQGFESTTVAQIADASGISQRSFFRYFPTKEDVVIDDPADAADVLRAAFRARPMSETPWIALRETLRLRTAHWQVDLSSTDLALRLLEDSPGLQARLLQKTVDWQRTLVPEVAERLQGEAFQRSLHATALTGAAFACLDAAFTAWLHDRARSLDALLDDAMRAVRPADHGDERAG